MKILVTAAHGNQGRILLPKLRAAGFEIRAIRATAGKNEELKEIGASEVMVGNAADRGFLAEAVAGVDTIYHVGPTAHPLERDMGFAMVDAAREAGVGHMIYSSAMHPIASKMIQHNLKREVEEHLLEANINFTVLQPADYMFPPLFQLAFQSGRWEQLYDLDRGQAMVDIEDITDVAVKVASEREAHFGATYQLCAPGNHSGHDIAAAIRRVTGKDVEAVWISPDDYFEQFYGKGKGDRFRYELALIRAVGLWYTQYVFAGNPNVLTWLLGRSPVTLDEFIAREWKKYQSAQA
jgi:uncharacterized protein YbjT (DUF2867 family)